MKNPMLAKPYQEQPITGWLMSEKLDGVRAIWTGSELLSRNGNAFSCPEWFTSQLPSGVMLDGELFIARGKFQTTVGIVRKKAPIDSEWRQIRYCVFDAPAAAGGFEARLAFCEETLRACEIAECVAHRICCNKADLDDFFTKLCALGAEGVMLRAPGSKYENRRSANLLKYKPFDSAEALMIGHESGQGKYDGRVGALILKWNEVVFKVGSGLTDILRNTPPPIGSTITFGFCGLTDGGIPRFPTFISERDYE